MFSPPDIEEGAVTVRGTSIVLVWGTDWITPSLTVHVIVRTLVLGVRLLSEYVTCANIDWYSATEAEPVRVSVPVARFQLCDTVPGTYVEAMFRESSALL
jgi:hypothetical protein